MFRIVENLDFFKKSSSRKDYKFDYQSFILHVCVQSDDKYLKLFTTLIIGKGYSNVTMTWNGCIINKNCNRCKVIKYTGVYPTIDGLLRGSDKWIEINKLHTYADGTNQIEINVTIESCDFKTNESKMIQGIYEKLFGQDEFYLIKYENTIGNLQNELKKSHDKFESLSFVRRI